MNWTLLEWFLDVHEWPYYLLALFSCFMAESPSIFVCDFFLFYSSLSAQTELYSSYFYILTIFIISRINRGVHIFFWISIHKKTCSLYRNTLLKSWGNSILFLQSGTSFHLTVHNVFSFPLPHQFFLLLVFLRITAWRLVSLQAVLRDQVMLRMELRALHIKGMSHYCLEPLVLWWQSL